MTTVEYQLGREYIYGHETRIMRLQSKGMYAIALIQEAS